MLIGVGDDNGGTIYAAVFRPVRECFEHDLRPSGSTSAQTIRRHQAQIAPERVNGSRKLTPSRQVKSDPLVSSSLR